MLLNRLFYTYYPKKTRGGKKRKWKCRLVLLRCHFPCRRRRRHISPVTFVPIGQVWPAEVAGSW